VNFGVVRAQQVTQKIPQLAQPSQALSNSATLRGQVFSTA